MEQNIKHVVVGLDIGSNLSGVSVIDIATKNLLLIKHIDSRKGKSIWEKADISLYSLYDILKNITSAALYVEENPQRYRSGMSSAKTINVMAKFNALLTYGARKILCTEPIYISAQSARKLCGIRAKGGQAAKDEAFQWASAQLSTSDCDHSWQLNKVGNPCAWCYDMADSYVIARAGALIESRNNECTVDSESSFRSSADRP